MLASTRRHVRKERCWAAGWHRKACHGSWKWAGHTSSSSRLASPRCGQPGSLSAPSSARQCPARGKLRLAMACWERAVFSVYANQRRCKGGAGRRRLPRCGVPPLQLDASETRSGGPSSSAALAGRLRLRLGSPSSLSLPELPTKFGWSTSSGGSAMQGEPGKFVRPSALLSSPAGCGA